MAKLRYDATGSDLDELRPYLVGEQPRENGEWDMFCPLHDDSNRSAQLEVDKEVWYCHACEEGGTVQDLLRRKSEWVPRSEQANGASAGSSGRSRSSSGSQPEELSEARVRRWANALLEDEMRMTELQDLRGLWKQTIIDYEIGWDDVRRAFTIPIRGHGGELLNVRRYQPNPASGRRKVWSALGHGKPVLFPVKSLNDRYVIVCEGEFDAIITNQHGFPAVTRTASASTWSHYWNSQFKNKLVMVCHDMDAAGKKANEKVRSSLEGVADEVRVVRLPYKLQAKHGKDLTDWWLEHEGDTTAFRELLRTAKAGKVVKLKLANGKVVPKREEYEDQDSSRLDPTQLTDDGNAKRFIQQHRGRLIYAPDGGWFRWSRQHFTHERDDRRLWKSIGDDMVRKDVKRTLRGLLAEALEYEDRDDLQRAFKWALRCRSAAATVNCLKMAESGDPDMPDLTVSLEELDKNPDVINTASGIVDLRTGELMPHDQTELCTRITNAAFSPKASRKEWQKFLNRIMPDRDLQRHLQLCMGASITGHTTRSLAVLYGPEGENGKSQLIEAVAYVLGTYAGSSMESTFTNANSREAGYDLARMRGVRFVSFSETREGHGLASERVKRITGDDTIDARNPYGRPFSFRPTFSLWVGTNHAPYIPAWETAMWKRIRVWPMFEVIPKEEQIQDYGRILARDHGSAILSWLVDGAKAFYVADCRLGKTPTTMDELRVEWQQRDDIVTRWLHERTEPEMRAKASFRDLWFDFTVWCDQQGEQKTLQLYTARKFHEEMDKNHPYPRGPMIKGYPTRAGLMLIQGERVT